MTGASPLLSADQIRELLVELGARLDAEGIEARVFLVGGAAMALAYGRDRVTRDVDAVFEPKRRIYDIAHEIAQERGLPPDWINDGAKRLLQDRIAPSDGHASFTAPGIRVGVAPAEYLFAMKALAARQETDADDLRRLASIIGITRYDDALDLVGRYYGRDRIGPKTALILEDLLGGAPD